MDQDEEEIVYGDQSANAIATNSAALPQASSTPTPAPPTLVAVPGLSVGETAEADGASKAAVEQQDLEEGEEEEEEEEVEVEVEESDDVQVSNYLLRIPMANCSGYRICNSP